MKHFKYAVSFMMVLALVLVFIGCAQPPEAKKSAAKAAGDAAVAAGDFSAAKIHADDQSLIPKSSNVPTSTQGLPKCIARDMLKLSKGLMGNLIKEAHADNGCPDGYPYDCGNDKCCSLPLCCSAGGCCPAGKPWSCPYNSETKETNMCYPEPDTDEGLAWLRDVCAALNYCR